MPEASLPTDAKERAAAQAQEEQEQEKYQWRPGMSREEKDTRESWIAGARGRKGLRIVIVTGELDVLLVCEAHGRGARWAHRVNDKNGH